MLTEAPRGLEPLAVSTALPPARAFPYWAAAAPMVWGSTYLVTTQWLPTGRPLLAAAVRALPAGILLSLFGRRLPPPHWGPRVICLGMLNIGIFFALLFVAAYRLPGGVAAVIGALQPLLVVLLWALLFREYPAPTHVLTAAAGAVGVSFLVLQARARLDVVGILAAAAATSSMALGTVLAKRWGRPEGVSVSNFTGWQLVVGGSFLSVLTGTLEGLPITLSPANLLGFAYLSIFGALLAYPLWFRGIDGLPVASASLLILLSPVVAMTLGYFVLHQSLTPLQALGAGLVLAAVVIGQRSRGAANRTPSAKHAPGRAA
jgi:probable blue pigment (indigoidine) exporter